MKKCSTYKNSYCFMYEFWDKSLEDRRYKKLNIYIWQKIEVIFLSNKDRVKNINEYKKRKENRYKKRKIKRATKPILLVFPVISIIIINLCGNAIVSNYKYEINTLEKKLRKEEIKLDELKMKQLENSSITNIEENAKEKLNMDYPNESQTRYIDLND